MTYIQMGDRIEVQSLEQDGRSSMSMGIKANWWNIDDIYVMTYRVTEDGMRSGNGH